MKKLHLVIAVTTLTISAAQAAPTLYGKAFLTTDYVNGDVDYNDSIADNSDNNIPNNSDDSIPNNRNDSSTNSLQVNSTTSRIGLKGSEAITANTDVIYQLEYGIAVDASDDDVSLKSRDTYLGLLNKDYGEFRFGRNYSVTDYINNVTVNEGYWDNIGASGVNEDDSITSALTLTDGDRINNSIVWIAPEYNGLPLALALQYSADERFNNANNDDRGSGFGASVLFDANLGFTAGIAYDKDMSINGDILRGSATVDLSKYAAYPVTLGALYQQTDYEGLNKEKGVAVSAQMNLVNFAHPTVAYLQYDTTKDLGGMENFDSNQIVVGAKYSYKDNMIAHAYVGKSTAELDTTDVDVFAIGGGLEYLF